MVEYIDFHYWPKNENRMLHIWLPDDFYQTDERYPVMYFFDGHNLFYDDRATYGKSWGFPDFLSQWAKKIIIVGMECSHNGYDRLSEYCPYEKTMFHHQIHGIGEETFQWIVHDVKPFIDGRYRTYSHREATGVGGSSMGGIMSVYGALRYNDIFSKAACVSPGVFHNLSHFRETLEESDLNGDTRMFFSWGENEAGKAAYNGNPEFDTREARSVYKFERELQERGIMTYHYFQWGGNHNEASWEQQIPTFMNWLWM